mmetsp:Transcript_21667/g.63086  ORF Transcript_21667/g.63086 Transcript_21667/m.63086 type:complete len:522 (-) Transcript_21667:26-1591(-)
MEGHDAAYLKESVGPALSQALTAMVTEQPTDSVDYLGRYLLAYVKREEGREARELKFKKAQEVAEAYEKAQQDKLAKEAEEAKLADMPVDGEETLVAKLGEEVEVTSLFPEFLELVKAGTTATSTYIGVKTGAVSGRTVISFVSGSEGSDMTGKGLVGGNPDDEEDKPEGVSFGAFKELEVPEEEEPAEPEEPAEGEEAAEKAPKGPQFLEQLVVENVVRDSTVKFFGVPKLGAYAAVPIRYQSCLHSEGVAVPEVPPEDGSQFVPGYQTREMLLGLHTMGQGGRQFSEQELAFARRLAALLGQALERSEKALWDDEVARRSGAKEAEDSLAAAVAEAKAAAEAKQGEEEGKLSEELLPETKDLEAKKLALSAGKEAFAVAKDALVTLGSSRVPPKNDALKLLQALLLTLGYDKDSFMEPVTGFLDWEKGRLLLKDPALAAKMEAYDPSDLSIEYPRSASTTAIRKLTEIESSPEEHGPLFPLTQAFIQKACDVRDAAPIARDAEAAKAAEEAAAEAAEGE